MKNSTALDEQFKNIRIPYPDKYLLKIEVEEHLIHAGSLETSEVFSKEESSELYELHNTFLFKFLDRLNPRIRNAFEMTLLGSSITSFLIFLLKEKFMIEFIRQGGIAMWPILLLGILLIYREFHLFFRTVIVKDHSKSNLNIDSNGVIVGAFALMALGIGSTALGIQVSANTVLSNNLTVMTFIEGIKESMGPLIVSSIFAACVFMVHFTTRRLLASWKAPIA